MAYLRQDSRRHDTKVLNKALALLAPIGPWIYSKARTTSSVYIKFRDKDKCSLRIADHDNIEKYKYKWNIRTDYRGDPYLLIDDGVERYFYGPHSLAELAEDLTNYPTTPTRFKPCINLSFSKVQTMPVNQHSLQNLALG